MDYTPDDLQRALAPIVSLISKSEKARGKVAPGSWQHSMLAGNLAALRVALPLMDGTAGAEGTVAASTEELCAALPILETLIRKVEETEGTFAVGTSQHSLQRNRLKALRIAVAVTQAELARRS